MDDKEKLASIFAEALFSGAKQYQEKNEWSVLYTVFEQLQTAGFTSDEAMQILLQLIACAFDEGRKDW